MTEHTPGPWTIEEYGDEDAPALVIHKDTETRVCFMATAGSHGDPAKIEADAHLIAAAPDMLNALQEIDRYWSSGNFTRSNPLWEQIRAALMKASAVTATDREGAGGA